MLLLVFFGILIDCSINKRLVIGLNVLQLIGLAYLGGAIIYELPRRWRPIIAGGLLILHWAAIRFISIPGVGAGFFEPDKNLIYYINQHLRPYHLAGIVSVVPTTSLVLIGTFFGDIFRDKNTSKRSKHQWGRHAGLPLRHALILPLLHGIVRFREKLLRRGEPAAVGVFALSLF